MNLYTITFILTFSHLVNAKCRSTGSFLRYQNEALTGHVIKTIPSTYIDCTMACGNLIGCRSVNFYKDEKGNEMCDLNKSTKTAHPYSVVSRPGYEYNELTARDGCSTEECLGSTNWVAFNSSQFSLFETRETWGSARNICRSHGGDLVSIYSQQEQDFISQGLLKYAPKGNPSGTKLIMWWTMDGTDVGLTFHGNAAIENVDGSKALYLDGNSANFVTTPPMELRNRGFTIGAWVKLISPASEGLVYGDWSPPYQFALKIDQQGKVSFILMFQSKNVATITAPSTISFNVWTHVMGSWGRARKTASIYINGEKKVGKVVNIAQTALMYTEHQYDIGLNRTGSNVLHGYIRELAVFSWPVISNDNALKRIGLWNKHNAVWTGLNDLSTENTFVFSDGSSMSYQNWLKDQPNDSYKYADCVAFSMTDYKWDDVSCGLKLPFICRKKVKP